MNPLPPPFEEPFSASVPFLLDDEIRAWFYLRPLGIKNEAPVTE